MPRKRKDAAPAEPNAEQQDKPPKAPRAKPRRDIKVVGGAGIEMMTLDALKPSPHNARVHTESQIAQLAGAMKKVGFRIPILIDENDVILSGHGRIMAARQAGLVEVPCLRVDDLTEAQKRWFMLADNRIQMNAGWDDDRLAREIQWLEHEGEIALADIGFDAGELTKLLAVPLEMPDLGDLDANMDTTPFPTNEGVAPPEDYDVAEDERQNETGMTIAPTPDAEKPRFHQLPPEDRTRAITASEERIPIAVVLNRADYDAKENFKLLAGLKTDKELWAHLKSAHMDPMTIKLTEERKDKMLASKAAAKDARAERKAEREALIPDDDGDE